MKLPLFTLLLFTLTLSHAQTIQDASALFAARKLDSAMVMTKAILNNDSLNADANVLAGRILTGQKNYDEAAGYLERALRVVDAPAYAKAWALCELGTCYFYRGDYKRAKECLSSCVAMNATKNSTSSAKNLMLKLGFDKVYDSWTTKESAHFVFHFQDPNSPGNIDGFIQVKEAAFESINSFFGAKLPKKIDYFVWSNLLLAESLFRHKLAFSDGALCITHTEASHTIGHEMTHSIAANAFPHAKWDRLINEGVAVYFDQSHKNNLALLKPNKEFFKSIPDFWKNESAGEAMLYPLGGELVKRLIENFGREKFLVFMNDQSYENARIVFGEKLDAVLKELEAEIQK